MGAEEEWVEPVYRFFFAWFGWTLAAFPLVATVDANLFGGSLGSSVVLGISVVGTIPAALEFLFSDRDPRMIGKFVAVFVVLYFLVILAQASVYVALGRTETIPVLEFALLFATYVVAYYLVYKGGLSRVRQAMTA